jgi:acyl dehydratase
MITVADTREAQALVGQHLGWSDSCSITQSRVDAFAAITDDEHWIHTDPIRARLGPFGGTIAHGYLTLALLPRLIRTVWTLSGFTIGVNYGMGKVRFPAPVPVGSKIRAGFQLDVITIIPGGLHAQLTATVQVVDAEKPSCIAELVYRYYERPPESIS